MKAKDCPFVFSIVVMSLSEWLKLHTDPLHNPWSEDEYEDTTPLSSSALICDPLHGREEEFVACSKK